MWRKGGTGDSFHEVKSTFKERQLETEKKKGDINLLPTKISPRKSHFSDLFVKRVNNTKNFIYRKITNFPTKHECLTLIANMMLKKERKKLGY